MLSLPFSFLKVKQLLLIVAFFIPLIALYFFLGKGNKELKQNEISAISQLGQFFTQENIISVSLTQSTNKTLFYQKKGESPVSDYSNFTPTLIKKPNVISEKHSNTSQMSTPTSGVSDSSALTSEPSQDSSEHLSKEQAEAVSALMDQAPSESMVMPQNMTTAVSQESMEMAQNMTQSLSGQVSPQDISQMLPQKKSAVKVKELGGVETQQDRLEQWQEERSQPKEKDIPLDKESQKKENVRLLKRVLNLVYVRYYEEIKFQGMKLILIVHERYPQIWKKYKPQYKKLRHYMKYQMTPQQRLQYFIVPVVVYYLIYSILFYIVARKFGIKHTWLALFPIFQEFFLMRMAHCSRIFFFLFLIPFVHVIWILFLWARAASLLCKFKRMAGLMLVPGPNLLGLIYLAL